MGQKMQTNINGPMTISEFSPQKSLPTSSIRLKNPLALAAIVALYLGLVGVTIATKLPICDEGWYGEPAFRLASGESMGTPALETAGTPRRGLERHTYWVMPLFMVVQAGVYKIAGLGLWQMRGVSALCGLLLVMSWYLIVRALTDDVWIPLLAAAIIAVDFQVISISATGRSDALCAGLGSAGLAIYLWERKRNLRWALFLSHTLVVASGLTHPCGFYYLLALLFLMLCLDRKALDGRALATTLIPYSIGGILWGTYILKAPGDFVAQFGSNASARAWVLTKPAGALIAEISRYREAYGFGASAIGASHLKILVLAVYVAGVLGVLLTRSIRQTVAARLLLFLTGLFFLALVYLEGAKQPWYLIHIIPAVAALLAVWIGQLYRTSPRGRWLALTALGGLMLLNVMAIGGVSHRKNLQTHYAPLVSFLHRAAPDSATVMGGAEIGFGLGFDRVKDDFRLGYYSGASPEWIVVDENYRSEFRKFQGLEPRIWAHVQHRLKTEYVRVFDDGYYTVYSRLQSAPVRSGPQG